MPKKERIFNAKMRNRRLLSTGLSARAAVRGSLVVKVTVSWLTCYEFEPSTTENKPCRGGRCALNMSRLIRSPVGVVWKLGEGGASLGIVLVT
ncbi:hypothetical protein TNCV_4909331 [Trichonephila clavipes]|uniref:Uncharacterized protein n=1 Tax=Trichonephila clavipes TaxID=2585209 RepID=A0A8X6RQ65_TRICX|nr:hypothetical protein TNCV_4909331 [Trichonephila clavipes]